MIRRTALRPRGVQAARWDRWRESQRRITLNRAGHGCEACGKRDRYVIPDLHHLTQQQVSEPWRSSSALTAALCRSCHDEWHDGRMAPEVRSGLLWAAAWRLSDAMGRLSAPKFGLPLDTILSLIREADERGIMPPGYEEER